MSKYTFQLKKIPWKRIGKILITIHLPEILIGTLSALIASCIFAQVNVSNQNGQVSKRHIDTIEALSIGSSKEWLDENLSKPQFEFNVAGTVQDRHGDIDYNYLGCVYMVEEIGVVRAFFEDDSCKAFFVTIRDDASEDDIDFASFYGSLAANKNILGKKCYHDILGEPARIGGFFTNGTGRCLYYEEYYYNSGGNHYQYYFASLDYGIKETVLQMRTNMVYADEAGDDEANFEKASGIYTLVIKDRNVCIPNTYGVAGCEEAVALRMLEDYEAFDSYQWVADDIQEMNEEILNIQTESALH